MTRPVSILIVDDHTMVRNMLAHRLGEWADMHVVAAVGTADEAVAMAAQRRPDIILMDIDMPGIHCFDAAKTIQSLSPETRIVYLSGFFHDRYIEQALAARAWGYVTKTEPEDAIIQAIRKVASGVTYFSPKVQERLIVSGGGLELARNGQSRISTLSEREIEVLRHIARGLSQKEIAATMHISAHTVHRHTHSLMDKLDIHNRVELARYAIREGLAEA